MRNAEPGKENDVLYVKSLGGFSLAWHDKRITGGTKSSESQFIYLMQYLIHHHQEGVERDQLENILFEGREMNNIHHALQSVIYNAKKRLRQAGIEHPNLIQVRKGRIYWAREVPVVEDAREFDRLYQEAERAETLERKAALYLQACYTYTGEFLPMQTGILWVAQEARRYLGQFCDCVEKATALLRVSQDYLRMEELGIYAAKIHPLADWETVTMEALVSMGRYSDARKLYDDTVALYFQEQGLRPSKRLMEMLNKLGAQFEHSYAVLDEIQMELSGGGESGSGGYLCSYPVFQGVYRMVERMMERGGQSVYLMLCTVVDSKGNPMREGPILEELSQRLGEAIQRSVRHSDAVNRYSKGQYLVLLVNTTRENCDIIQRRINYHFIVGRQRTGIQYYVNSVVCTPEGKKKD